MFEPERLETFEFVQQPGNDVVAVSQKGVVSFVTSGVAAAYAETNLLADRHAVHVSPSSHQSFRPPDVSVASLVNSPAILDGIQLIGQENSCVFS